MVLRVFRMVGDNAHGYDGYGTQQEVTLPPRLASSVRQELWYAHTVTVTL